MGEINLYSTTGPICPHCGHEHQAEGPSFYDESNDQFDCDRCGEVFTCLVSTSTSWYSEPLPTPAQP